MLADLKIGCIKNRTPMDGGIIFTLKTTPRYCWRNVVMEEKTSVLIVDDNASLVKTMSFVLRRQGYTAAIAQDGKQAIAMVKESHFDIVFMDIRIPLMDGV